MMPSFFDKEGRAKRSPSSSFPQEQKIRLIKAALCSHGIGESTTETALERLFNQIDVEKRQWAPSLQVPQFSDESDELHWKQRANQDPALARASDYMDALSPSLFLGQASANFAAYGRTRVVDYPTSLIINENHYDAIALKVINKEETQKKLRHELNMQKYLSLDTHFRSIFPRPLHAAGDAISFLVPKGYYHYLSQIKEIAAFTESACRAAHDLGYLLAHYGQVFPELVSILHSKPDGYADRPYTLLPRITNAAVGQRYGGLPGKIDKVIGENLYENIGKTGLRDLGDLQNINDYKFPTVDDSGVERIFYELSMPLKIAHFISLYLMVFTLLIGNRSRMLESLKDEAAWLDNDRIYSAILHALFEGLSIRLSPEMLAYMDPSQLKETEKIQPGDKFNRQLYFAFTDKKNLLFNGKDYIPSDSSEIKIYQEELERYYGSSKVTFYCGDGQDAVTNSLGVRRAFLYGGKAAVSIQDMLRGIKAYDKAADFSRIAGQLGSYSGINPLTTACKYALRAAQVAVMGLYHLPLLKQGMPEETQTLKP